MVPGLVRCAAVVGRARLGHGLQGVWAGTDLGLLGHLTFFVMPLVPAIVLRGTVGRAGRFTRHHTTEALNAQIWFVVIWNALLLPLILTSRDGGDTPAWALLGLLAVADRPSIRATGHVHQHSNPGLPLDKGGDGCGPVAVSGARCSIGDASSHVSISTYTSWKRIAAPLHLANVVNRR